MAGFSECSLLSQKRLLVSFELKRHIDTTGAPAGTVSASLLFVTDEGAAFGATGYSFGFDLIGNVVIIPEPASAMLLGVLAFVMYRRRR